MNQTDTQSHILFEDTDRVPQDRGRQGGHHAARHGVVYQATIRLGPEYAVDLPLLGCSAARGWIGGWVGKKGEVTSSLQKVVRRQAGTIETTMSTLNATLTC